MVKLRRIKNDKSSPGYDKSTDTVMRQFIKHVKTKIRKEEEKLNKLQEQVDQKEAEEPVRKRKREDAEANFEKEKEKMIEKAIELLNVQKEENRKNL